MTSGLPILQARSILGYRPKISGGAQYISDEDAIYPVGAVITVQNVIQKRQRFIKLPDKGRDLSAIVLSPNRKLVAIVEKGVQKPSITLYCTQTVKKKRIITLTMEKEVYPKEFIAVSFTFDSKQLIVVSGEPDWTMYNFKVDNGKLENYTRAQNSNNTGYIRQIACNPNDSNLLVLVGDGLIRILACSETVWRQYGYNKGDQWNLTCAAWISQERLLAGTHSGQLLVLESGELKLIVDVKEFHVLDLKFPDEIGPLSATSLKRSDSDPINEDEQIRSLVTFPRGFAFGHENGTVYVFEMETPQKFVKRNVFHIPNFMLGKTYSTLETNRGGATNSPGFAALSVTSLSVNPSQDKILVTCQKCQVYVAILWVQDLSVTALMPLTPFGPILHEGTIGGMSLCAWKPLLMTCGRTDRTLRIWNYETDEVELLQRFEDDLFGIALHPSGHYAIVGFTDKLRFMTITIDEFDVRKEFPVRMSRLCSFSKQGHLFAANNGNLIQIYSTVTFELLYILKGHSGKIVGMSWQRNDKKLASASYDGTVYEWTVTESKRTNEYIIKGCGFTGLSLSGDGKNVYTCAEDCHIRQLMNSNVHRDVVPIAGIALDTIAMSQLDQVLLVSGNHGTIYNVKLPLLEKAEFVEYVMHASRITRMVISFDDRYLFTGTVDGTICVWRLLNMEGRSIKIDKDFKVCKDVMIPRQLLEERMTKIIELQTRLKEMESEFTYQLKQSDVIHTAKVKDIHAGYCGAIEELKDKNEQMVEDHNDQIAEINTDIGQMRKAHEEFVAELEANYNLKLISEYEKYMRLEEKMDVMRKNYDHQLDELQTAKTRSEQQITTDFVEQLAAKQTDYDELAEKSREREKMHEIIKQQIEDDADREIYELRAYHANELKQEQDVNVKIRSETATVKKRMTMYQKEVEDLKQEVYVLQSEHEKFKKAIFTLEREIVDLKKEIAERDSTVRDKERRIAELKHRNQELDKFKFILEFKINELKTQIEPREKTIEEQIIQINEMVRELENLQRVILNLDVQMHGLKEKLVAGENRLQEEMARNTAMKRSMKKVKIDIYEASRYIQDVPKLVRTVTRMYHKWNTDENFELIRAEETDVKNEFLRQRVFLENTVASVQQQLGKSTQLGHDRVKLVEENATLLVETNELRKSLKLRIKESNKMHTVLGIARHTLPTVAQERIRRATATRDDIHEEYRSQLLEGRLVTEALQDENERLTGEIIDVNVNLMMDEELAEEEVPDDKEP